MRPAAIVTVHQPQYLPYVGMLSKIVSSDVFVSYDTAAYQKNYFNNRNRVMTQAGQVWLTIPVHARLGCPLMDVTVDGNRWKRKHLRTVRHLYGRSPNFDLLFPGFEAALCRESRWLVDYADSTLDWILASLGVSVGRVRASSFVVPAGLSAQEKLVALTAAVGGTAYLAGPSWRAYMEDIAGFRAAGIHFLESGIHQRPYESLTRYAESMSVIDLLFSCGPASLSVVRASITVQEVER